MDKFPEAFKRFEKDVDTSDIRSPYELLEEFGIWSGDHFRDTSRMRFAVGREAEKKGMQVPLSFYRREREPSRRIRVREIVTTTQFIRRGKTVYALRGSKGRFVSPKSEYEIREAKKVEKAKEHEKAYRKSPHAKA